MRRTVCVRLVRCRKSGGCNRFRRFEDIRPPVGQGRNHPHRGAAGPSEPSRVPARHCAFPVFRLPCPSPHRVGPRPLTFSEQPFHGAGSRPCPVRFRPRLPRRRQPPCRTANGVVAGSPSRCGHPIADRAAADPRHRCRLRGTSVGQPEPVEQVLRPTRLPSPGFGHRRSRPARPWPPGRAGRAGQPRDRTAAPRHPAPVRAPAPRPRQPRPRPRRPWPFPVRSRPRPRQPEPRRRQPWPFPVRPRPFPVRPRPRLPWRWQPPC